MSNESIREKEETFQQALKAWDATGDKAAWETMYYRVYDACHNIAAKLLVGVKLDPEIFEDRVMDSALYVLERIKGGLRPKKLSSYCYLVCKGKIHGRKQQFEDSIQYVPEIFEYLQAEVGKQYDEE